MGTITSIIQLHAEELRQCIQQAMVQLGVNTSGATAAGIAIEHTATGYRLVDTNGSFYFAEYGRGPAKNKNAKPGGAMVYAIEKWIEYKGIQPEKGTARSLAFAIATHINRYGTKRYQSGRSAGIIEQALNDDYLTRLALAVIDNMLTDFDLN